MILVDDATSAFDIVFQPFPQFNMDLSHIFKTWSEKNDYKKN